MGSMIPKDFSKLLRSLYVIKAWLDMRGAIVSKEYVGILPSLRMTTETVPQ